MFNKCLGDEGDNGEEEGRSGGKGRGGGAYKDESLVNQESKSSQWLPGL